MTLNKWSSLYKAYRSEFDRELNMRSRGQTYADAEREPNIDEIIPI